MTVSHSSSTTSLMPQLDATSVPSSIWGALTNLFTSRGTPRDEEMQHIEPEGSLPLLSSTQTPASSPDGVSPSQMADFSLSQPMTVSSLPNAMAYSPPSKRIAGPSSSAPVASSLLSQPAASSSPQHPVKDFPISESATGPSKQSRSSRPSRHPARIERPTSSEKEPENRFPSIIVRDFAYMPRPPLLYRPVDEQWVVNITFPPGSVPGAREREAIEWEASHRHLYRLGGNRADPPNTIPKTWGGLSKAEDDEMMRRAQARVKEARQRTLALGLTPTEPNIGAPIQNYSAMTDEEREAIARVDASIREQMATARREGYEPPIKTPPNTPPPPGRTHTQVFAPSSPPTQPHMTLSSHTSTRHSKRKREESDNEHADSKVATGSKRQSHKRQSQEHDDKALNKDTSPRYLLRRRTPSSSSRTSSIKPTASSKGKGKARAL